MKLKDLISDLSYELIQGNIDTEIDNICWDSRNVTNNCLFICTKNKNVDRHQYVKDAIKDGANTILIEHDILNVPKNITVIKVKNSRTAMANISNKYYGEPSKKFNLIGITGTNGKTSVAFFITKILETLGHQVGIISTIENRIGSLKLKTKKINPTTPDSIELQSSFKEMLDKNAATVVMEVTSAALEQHRVDNCDFDIGIFTNLSQDHLDEHGTMENYKNAKLKLFNMCRLGIINADDKIYQEIEKNSLCDIITYGINNSADFMAKNILFTSDGTNFILDFRGNTKNVSLKTVGLFNIYNALTTIASCYFLGIPLDTIVDAINNIDGVKGRFEFIKNPKEISVIVDYAHTPDALKNILTSLKVLGPKKIITVFGCGGNRDTSKRAIMGEIAGNLSDFCIITSDNPRNESSMKIIDTIETGLKKTSCPHIKIENRKNAIYKALKMAQVGDTILIAGKGHENYQIIGEEIIHFDDVEIVKEFFEDIN